MAKAKRQSTKKTQTKRFEESLVMNGLAISEGPRAKSWSQKDLKCLTPLTRNQEEAFREWFEGQHLCMHGSAGAGKAQPLHSKILTPTGWTTMGDIRVGDTVSTPDGKGAKVLGIFPQGKKDIYKITFSDGASTECCLEHLWNCNVPTPMYSRKKSSKRVVNTEFIINYINERQNVINEGKKIRPVNISIDLIEPVEMPEQQLLIDPYLLGVLIGDGCVRTATPIITTNDVEILNNIQKIIEDGYCLNKPKGSKYDYKLRRIKRSHDQNSYVTRLEQLQLQGLYSHEKFIPEMYKKSSIQQRLALIQGLMDTDGTVGRTGGVSFTSTSKRLADDVRDIMWSLGAKCSIRKRHPSYKDKQGNKIQGKESYTINISYKYPQGLFRLARKRIQCSEQYQDKQLKRYIHTVEKINNDNAQCIMIDHPDHLYITDDYIITHNTFLSCYMALDAMLKKHQDKIIIIRSAVQTRNVGALPGTLEEKLMPYELPYHDIFHELLGRKTTFEDMTKAGKVEFISTSYIRGITWDNAIIIVDEFQNMTFHEINSIMTRVGNNSRIIVCGDILQTDLSGRNGDISGAERFLRVIQEMRSFSSIQFNVNDIVRSGFVKSWIQATEIISK